MLVSVVDARCHSSPLAPTLTGSMGAPTKKRGSAPSGVARRGAAKSACACVSAPGSDGICDLSVWLGTTIDPTAAQSHQRLLRPDLPVVKYKHWSLLTLSGATR